MLPHLLLQSPAPTSFNNDSLILIQRLVQVSWLMTSPRRCFRRPTFVAKGTNREFIVSPVTRCSSYRLDVFVILLLVADKVTRIRAVGTCFVGVVTKMANPRRGQGRSDSPFSLLGYSVNTSLTTDEKNHSSVCVAQTPCNNNEKMNTRSRWLDAVSASGYTARISLITKKITDPNGFPSTPDLGKLELLLSFQ